MEKTTGCPVGAALSARIASGLPGAAEIGRAGWLDAGRAGSFEALETCADWLETGREVRARGSTESGRSTRGGCEE
ncbi:MAG: hypothetical protein AAF997_22565 [Myxococcota bacterium]